MDILYCSPKSRITRLIFDYEKYKEILTGNFQLHQGHDIEAKIENVGHLADFPYVPNSMGVLCISPTLRERHSNFYNSICENSHIIGVQTEHGRFTLARPQNQPLAAAEVQHMANGGTHIVFDTDSVNTFGLFQIPELEGINLVIPNEQNVVSFFSYFNMNKLQGISFKSLSRSLINKLTYSVK